MFTIQFTEKLYPKYEESRTGWEILRRLSGTLDNGQEFLSNFGNMYATLNITLVGEVYFTTFLIEENHCGWYVKLIN